MKTAEGGSGGALRLACTRAAADAGALRLEQWCEVEVSCEAGEGGW